MIFLFNKILLKYSLHNFCFFIKLLSNNKSPIFFNIAINLSLKTVISISFEKVIFSKNKLNMFINFLLIIFLILFFLFRDIMTSIIFNKHIRHL